MRRRGGGCEGGGGSARGGRSGGGGKGVEGAGGGGRGTEVPDPLKMFPVYPVRSHAEAFVHFKMTLGTHQTNVHSVDINRKQYMLDCFTVACDTEKHLSAGFTGLNKRICYLITIKTKSMSSNATDHPTRIYVTSHSDNVLNIRDAGVDVFD